MPSGSLGKRGLAYVADENDCPAPEGGIPTEPSAGAAAGAAASNAAAQ